MKRKDLNHYLDLDYDVKVVKIEEDGEVSYMVYSDDLDRSAFYGVGESKDEALRSFEDVRHELFEHYYENNLPIPEPSRFNPDLPSGRFVLRIQPALHARLIALANAGGKSLNSFIEGILIQYYSTDEMLQAAREEMSKLVHSCEARVFNAWVPMTMGIDSGHDMVMGGKRYKKAV